ncbi:MAG: DUF2442 domain-containing protein, partial [Microcystaceae cyanobacterium]
IYRKSLLMLWFYNEEQKIFDLKPYLNKGIFSQLKNISLFTSARVVAGSVEWPNGLDLSYDTLYLESIATPNVTRDTAKPLK